MKRLISKLASAAAAALALAALLPAPARAGITITVNTTMDDPSATCASAGSPCSLRGAITKANSTAGWDTIIVPTGTYTLTLAGINENNNATGDLDILDSVTIIGAGGNPNGNPALTIIQAGTTETNGLDKVMSINANWDQLVSATIQAVTIRHGRNVSNYSGDGMGGGLDFEATPFENPAIPGAGTLTLDNVIITKNATTDGDGGGVNVISGLNRPEAKLIITRSEISYNTSTNGDGAGLDIQGATFEISNTTIKQNTTNQGASRGGYAGGLNARSPSGQTSKLINSTISGNVGTGGHRGAGGIITSGTGGSVEITNVTVSGNSAPGSQGGGLWLNGGSFTMTNSTVVENTGGSLGGGIYWGESGTFTLRNSIVADNIESGVGENNIHGVLGLTGDHNLIGTGANNGGLINGLDGNQVGVANPGLLALANNGGSVQTRALSPTSPAVDKGSNAHLSGITTDARGTGFARTADGDGNGTATVDIGAYELQSADLAISKSHAGSFDQGQANATYTITVSNVSSTPSNGAVTVTETLPAGLTNLRMSGAGWTCNNGAGTCTRSDALPGGSAYPNITVLVDVAANASSSVTNTASVSGGGESNPGTNNTDTDPTAVRQTTATTVAAAGGQYGSTVTLSATVTPAVDGTVTFSVGGSPVGTAAVNTTTGAATLSYQISAGVGTPAITAAFTPTFSIYIPSGGSSVLTVTQAPLTIRADNKSKTYGSENPTFTATYTGFVLSETPAFLGGTLSLSTAADANSGAGTYQIAVSGQTSANYNITYFPGTLTIAKAPLTVQIANASKTYGQANPAFSATYSGFVLSDTAESALTGTLTLSTAATQSSGAGTYDIDGSGLSAANYAITYDPGTLTVTPAPLTVTANGASRLYGAANPTFTASYSGFVLTDTPAVLGGTATFTTPAVVSSPVDTYPITPSGLTSANYTITFVNGTLTVTPAPLTVRADDKARTYGAPDPAYTVSLIGLVAGDTPLTAVTGTPSFTTTATTGSPVDDYTITPSGLSSANYTLTYADGTLTIHPAALLVRADNKSKTYGQMNPPLTVTYDGLVLGEEPTVLTGSVTPATAATANSPVDSYAITLTGTLSSPNYSVSYADGTLTVGQAPLTITAGNASRTYGAATPAFTASYSGFVLDQNESVLGGSLSFTTPAVSASPVDEYAITPGGRTSDNYAITFVDGTLTVTPAPLTITAANATRLYGAANPAFTASYSGFVLGQTETALGGTLIMTSGAGLQSPVGDYAIAPTGRTSANYAITYVSGTLTVTRAPLTVTAQNTARIYGGPDPAFAVTYTGLVGGENPAEVLGGGLTFTTDAAADSAPGTYTITPSGLTAQNYEISYLPGSLAITRAPLAVAADSVTRLYGSANPVLTVTYTGMMLNEDPTQVLGTGLTVTTAAAADSPAGPYPITASGLSSANYQITYVPGTLTVAPAPLTVTAVDAARTYGSANPAFTVTYSGFVAGDTGLDLGGTLTLSTPAVAASPADEYAITPSGLTSANYAITFVDGTLTVNPAPLTVTANDATRLYGSPDPTFSASYSGFVLGQTPAVLGGNLTFTPAATADSPVDDYALVPSGLTSANYAITFVNGTLSVTPAPLAVTTADAARTYGSDNPAFSATYSGFVAGDTAADLGGELSVSTAATAASPVGTYPLVPSGLTSANYAITFVPGTLTVTSAPLTVTAADAARLYGGANPTFSVTYSGLVLNEDPAAVLGGTLTLATAADESSPVSTYAITPSGLTSSNYAITFVPGTLRVNPAPLTVTADNKARFYGEANPPLTASFSGFVLGETEAVLGGTLSLVTTADPASPAGTYPITPSGLTAANYEITFVPGTLTVTQKVLTVTVDDAFRPYGSPNPAFSGTVAGVQPGDDITVTYSTAAGPRSPVGSYTISAQLSDPDGKLANYEVHVISGTLTVRPAGLVIGVQDASRLYGQPNPAFVPDLVGLRNGDQVTVSFETDADEDSPVGLYAVTPSVSDSGQIRNYQVTYEDGQLQVVRAPLTVTANNASRIVGMPNPPLNGELTGVRPGDAITAYFETTATRESPPGTYPIRAVLRDPRSRLGNYEVIRNDATLTVEACSVRSGVGAEGRAETWVPCRAANDAEQQVLGAFGHGPGTPAYLAQADAGMVQDAIGHAGQHPADGAPRLTLLVPERSPVMGGLLPMASVHALAEAGVDLNLQTPAGSLLVPAGALGAWAGDGAAGGQLLILIEELGVGSPTGDGLQPAGTAVEVTLATLAPDGTVTRHAQFPPGMTLSLPVGGLPDDELELAGIYRLDGGQPVYVGGEVDGNGNISVGLDHLSAYGVLVLDREYADVSTAHWAYRGIKLLSARHVVRGVGDNRFEPARTITQAEFVTMVARSFGVPVEPVAPGETWYAPVMRAVVGAGLLLPGEQRPEALITREEMAVVIARAVTRFYPGAPLPTPDVDAVLARFTDGDQVDPAAREALAQLVEMGLVRGRGEGLLAPKGTSTRAEAVTIIQRLLDWGKGR